MITYLDNRYSGLANLPVLKLDEGIGIFINEGHDTYSFSLKHCISSLDLSSKFKESISDIDALLSHYKVAHLGRRRKVTHKGREIINNIQCNIDGYAYSLPMGLKQLLNRQNIVPIILIPNQVRNLNNPQKEEYRKLNILNLKDMIRNMRVLCSVESYYYDNLFMSKTADLYSVKPLGKLIDKSYRQLT